MAPSADLGSGIPKIKWVDGVNPAAGVEITDVVPAGKYWVVLMVRATLVTSATVASRQVTWVFDDGTTQGFRTALQIAHPASNTLAYQGATGLGQDNVALTFPENSLPKVPLPPGSRIVTQTLNFQGTDDWGTPRYLVAEYDSPPAV